MFFGEATLPSKDAMFPNSFGFISHIHLGKISQEMFEKGWAIPKTGHLEGDRMNLLSMTFKDDQSFFLLPVEPVSNSLRLAVGVGATLDKHQRAVVSRDVPHF